MVYKSFRFLVVVRILLLIASVFLLVYFVDQRKHLVTSIILVALILFQVINMIRFVEKTNTKLTQFLESIRHADFSTSFSDQGLGKSFEALNKAFNAVINEFRSTRAEKEEHFNYLQTVIQHVNIGIIVYRKDGKVDIINKAAKQLFKINILPYIDDLKSIKSDFPKQLLKMNAGDKKLIKVFIDNELLQLSIYATEFKMRGEDYILISLQNISAELEEKEIESWQKLIRVLTHEIMNSITPISSLASTVYDLLIDKNSETTKLQLVDKEDVESIETALSTIQGRSQGLLNFVEVYRNLTRIPKPNFRYFSVKEMFDRCILLLAPKIEQLQINCNCNTIPENLMLTADSDLIDQVMINLILNAIDAVKEKENPMISVSATAGSTGRIIIELTDNGCGIKPDILDKIFMPFFTSKKEGSGIGLSLSRQIIHLHKGKITVKSNLDEGTTFKLTF
ncbi:MAG: GHKL domain-containing protein [Bacteroidales bacterium]|nr:GHKL domain-containing protein [Bacteroidales bacterium]